MARRRAVREERDPGAIGRPDRRGAIREQRGWPVTAKKPQLARQVGARVRRGRVHREDGGLAVGRDRDLGRRPERDQSLRHVAEGHVVLSPSSLGTREPRRAPILGVRPLTRVSLPPPAPGPPSRRSLRIGSSRRNRTTTAADERRRRSRPRTSRRRRSRTPRRWPATMPGMSGCDERLRLGRDGGQDPLAEVAGAGEVDGAATARELVDELLVARRPPRAAVGISSASRLAKIVPAIVRPTVPPICWKNVRLLVATPIRSGETAFWTISVKTANDGPIPSPAMTSTATGAAGRCRRGGCVSRKRPTREQDAASRTSAPCSGRSGRRSGPTRWR